MTGGRGADQVLDVVGASTIVESLRALRQDGLVSAIGFMSASEKHDLIPELIFGAKTSKLISNIQLLYLTFYLSPRLNVWQPGHAPGSQCLC